MKPLFFILFIGLVGSNTQAQTPSKVNFDDYEKLTAEVKLYRKDRLINWNTFNQISKEPNTVILDTRSKEMYDRKHVKGAIHLNFSDFTQANLENLIPDPNTRILIYCNNNFKDDPINFATKSYTPKPILQLLPRANSKQSVTQIKFLGIKTEPEKELTLALNIPTFINLYGYGYKNVYELSELLSVTFPRMIFEGTDVR